MNLLTLKFKATECNGWPKIRVLIDLDIIESCEFISDYAEVTVPIDLYDGLHSLTVELYGKTQANTKVDRQDNIIADQSVQLVDMLVDGISLPDIYKWRGVYKFNDQEHPQALTWCCNGVWQWDFNVPLITWLLDVKIEISEKYNAPKIPRQEYLEIEKSKIQKLEEQLSKL